MRKKVKGRTKAYLEARLNNIKILATREGCSWSLMQTRYVPKTVRLLASMIKKYEKLSELYGEDRVMRRHPSSYAPWEKQYKPVWAEDEE